MSKIQIKSEKLTPFREIITTAIVLLHHSILQRYNSAIAVLFG